jgi:hypothetical protein
MVVGTGMSNPHEDGGNIKTSHLMAGY